MDKNQLEWSKADQFITLDQYERQELKVRVRVILDLRPLSDEIFTEYQIEKGIEAFIPMNEEVTCYNKDNDLIDAYAIDGVQATVIMGGNKLESQD